MSTRPSTDSGASAGEFLDQFRRDLDQRAAALAYAAGLAAEFTPAGSYPYELDPDTDPDPVRAWRFALHECHVHHAALTEAVQLAEATTKAWQGWARDLSHDHRHTPALPMLADPAEPYERVHVLPGCVDPGRMRARVERVLADADAVVGAYDRHADTLRAARYNAERELNELHRARPTPTTTPDTATPDIAAPDVAGMDTEGRS